MIYFSKMFLLISMLASFLAISNDSRLIAKEILRTKDGAKSPKDRMDFKLCRKEALARSKNSLNPTKSSLKLILDECRDQFPGTAALTDCKKDAFTKYKSNKKKLMSALRVCRSRQLQLNYNSTSPLPAYVDRAKELAYFAGAGLNLPKRFLEPVKGGTGRKDLNGFGNFSCSPIEEVFAGAVAPEYLLFGNNPILFSSLRQYKPNDFLTQLKFERVKKEGERTVFLSRNFGEYYEYSDKAKRTLYFPTSFCYFANRLGNVYQGIKIYYLIDFVKKTLIPYFGLAFYNENRKIKVEYLEKEYIKLLGPGYKSLSKKEGVIYIAKGEINEFDDEGDPANLCKLPRTHEYVAIVYADDFNPQYADYTLLANIKNLCSFGDQLGKSPSL